MPPKLIILTNCSERKKSREVSLHLREVEDQLGAKARRWCKRLESTRALRHPAIDLYQGDHWASVLTLVRKAEQAGWDSELWVASAGYGLIPSHASVRPYAATFGANHADSVGVGTRYAPKEAAKRWWDYLSRWEGPEPGTPRSLRALAEAHPEAAWIFLMSPTYTDAVSNDLAEAMALMDDPDRVVLVSGTPGPSDPDLIRHWIPSLEICRGVLGGSCTSLNARVGAHLIQNYPPWAWSAQRIQPHANLWMASLPPLDRPQREGVTDEQARALIRKALRQNPNASHSALLRELRAAGVACEQKRFRDLFNTMQVSA